MARLARVVVAGVPHHVTQRGNRRLTTFFNEEDYAAYLSLLAEWCPRCGVELWAYCLMPNHVHLIAVPESEGGLGRVPGGGAWSRAAAQLAGKDDGLVRVKPLLERTGDSREFLREGLEVHEA